jgi:hypothetical protein
MKIISIDESISIENILYKELLIPVRVYKIPINIKNNDLNFLEETIFELKKIDGNLEINEIAKLLGLDDKKDLVKFILDKIENFKQYDGKYNEKIFFFYQELITGKPINLISKKIDEFCYMHNEKWSNIENIKNITFEKNNKKITAYSFKYNRNLSKLYQDDLIKIIINNNLNNNISKYLVKIPTNKVTNLNLNDYEEMFLNVKLFIPKNNRDTILVTNGFNGYSSLFNLIIREYFPEFVAHLKSYTQVKLEKLDDVNDNFLIPFENKINNYFEIKNLVKNIEKDYQKYLYDDSSSFKSKIKKNILKNLFDVLEKAFCELSKDLKYSSFITTDKIILILSEQSFIINTNMNLFKISKRNNIQKYIALAVFFRKEEINKLHRKSFIFLEKLLNYRNDLKHSKEEIDIENIDIKKYINIVYKILSIILNIKIINKQKENIINFEDENEMIFNSTFDIEREFIEILNNINSYIKEKLIDINFAVKELEFNKDSIKYAIENIYSLFECIFKQYPYIEKDKIFSKYNNLPIEFKSVKMKKSLGRFYLNYLYVNNKNDEKLTNFIAKIIRLRGHGNDNIFIPKKELKLLKEETFKFVKELLKERN